MPNNEKRKEKTGAVYRLVGWSKVRLGLVGQGQGKERDGRAVRWGRVE